MNSWGLPLPYEDELIYSVVARFRQAWGYLHRGEHHKFLSIPRGSRIRAESIRQIINYCSSPGLHGLRNPLYVAQNHSLLPYFLCFYSKEVRQACVRALAGAGECNKTVTSFRYRATGTCPFMRFCPCCQKDDMMRYGETYWRRAHQLPSVVVCLKHGVLLYRTSIPTCLFSCTDFIAAHPQCCISSRKTREEYVISETTSFDIAERSVPLLDKRLGRPADISIEGYRRLARAAGYRSSNGNVAYNTITNDLSAFLRGSSCFNAERSGLDWHRKAIHEDAPILAPVHHIIFRLFLSRSLPVPQPLFS